MIVLLILTLGLRAVGFGRGAPVQGGRR
jgi:hypothetical protein